jgi:hypothetical protein
MAVCISMPENCESSRAELDTRSTTPITGKVVKLGPPPLGGTALLPLCPEGATLGRKLKMSLRQLIGCRS